jgi:hypothetical protein
MSETRFVITGKNADGLRTLSEPRQRRYTYDTHEQAQEKLNAIHEVNDADKVKMCMGTELEVRPVECYVGGDPATCWFDSLEETERIMTEKESKK